MAGKVDKHLVYHQLMDSLEQDACPICSLINKNNDRFTDIFFFESVNDIKLRNSIMISRGFCNYHAWKLHKTGDPLGHAIIYKELIEHDIGIIDEYLEKTDDRRYTAGLCKDLNKDLDSKDKCPACLLAYESEKTYIPALCEYLKNDVVFKDKFRESGFLCRPHLLKVLGIVKDESCLRELLAIHKGKLRSLAHDLSEIQRKSDYRFSHEPMTNDEKAAWTKAVKKHAGEPGV